MHGRRGISEVVAAMLMITITIAAAIILYVYASGLMGSLQGAGTPRPFNTRLVMEYYRWPNGSSLVMVVRNIGVTEVNLTKAHFIVNGVSQNPNLGGCSILQPQDTCENVTISISGLGTLVVGVAYTLKIVTADGAVFSFSVVYGKTG